MKVLAQAMVCGITVILAGLPSEPKSQERSTIQLTGREFRILSIAWSDLCKAVPKKKRNVENYQIALTYGAKESSVFFHPASKYSPNRLGNGSTDVAEELTIVVDTQSGSILRRVSPQ